MALNIKRFLKAIGLVGNSSQTISSAGEIEFRSDLGKLSVHDGTSSDQILTENKAATIQNKNISGASNTITNIPNSATTATDANTASAIVARDAGGSFSATSISASLNGTATYAIGPSSGSGHGAVTLNGSNQFQSVAPSTAGNYLRSNGTDWAASGIQASDVPTLNQNTTGTAANITATSNSTLTTLPSLSLPGSQVTGNISGNAANVTGTVAIANGGTGQTSQTAAFNALSPLTTKGDIVVHTGSNNVRQAIGTDGQVLIADSAQTNGVRWTTLQQGSKNYISNSTFEGNSTTGWSLSHSTLDSTSKLPNQASGSWTSASGNLAIATTSSGKLAGSYSLQLTQSTAASVAGDMLVTDAMTIDTEDQAKVMSFSFYYSVTAGASNLNLSGTSSNSIGVAVYDVTNSTWIQPAGVFNLVQSSGVGLASGTFQTSSNGTQYRLAVYFPNASSGTFTMLLDDVVMGPQKVLMAPAMSDDVASSVTYSAAFGTTTNVSVFQSRRGDKLLVHGSFRAGTVAGSTAFIQLPFSMDTAKLGGLGTDVVGYYWTAKTSAGTANFSLDGSTANISNPLFFDGSTNNQVFLAKGAASNGYAKVNGSTILANNDSVGFWFEVPIAGWSSNTVSSADTDTRVIAAIVQGAPANVSVGNPIIFPSIVKDSAAAYNTSTGQYTAPVSGWYQVSSYAACTTASGNHIGVYVNGVLQAPYLAFKDVSATAYSGSVSVYANAGQTIDVRPTDVGLTSFGGAAGMSISRLSGPAVVQATETVAMSAGLTSVTNPGANAVIKYDTKKFDTHNAYSTSTGLYTISVSGKYSVSAVAFAAAAGTSIYVVKNGTGLEYLATVSSSSTAASGTTILQLNAGDTIGIYSDASTNFNGLLNSRYANTFSVVRVGN